MNERGGELRDLVLSLAELDKDSIAAQVTKLGLDGIGVAESAGGSGGTLGDLLVVVEEFAGSGTSTSLVESSCALWVHSRCDDRRAYNPQTALKVLTARLRDDETPKVLTEVPWAHLCERLIVVDGVGYVYDIDIAATQVTMVCNVAGEARDTVVIGPNAGMKIGEVNVEALRCRLALLRTASILGAAKGAYRVTKEHVEARHQFGLPLIRISAVAAQLALMKTHVLQIQSAFDRAVAIYETRGEDELRAAALIASVMATASAGFVARTAHQLHGAIGTTAEHALHRYTRALWAWCDDDGTPRHRRQQLGNLALTDGETLFWDKLTAPA